MFLLLGVFFILFNQKFFSFDIISRTEVNLPTKTDDFRKFGVVKGKGRRGVDPIDYSFGSTWMETTVALQVLYVRDREYVSLRVGLE